MCAEEFWNEIYKIREIIERIGRRKFGDQDIFIFEKTLKCYGIESWEVHGFVKGNPFFVISPNGNPDIFLRTKKFADAKPAWCDWEVLPAKMPKNWKRKFQWGDDGIEIDASRWMFDIKNTQRKYDITLDGVSTGQKRLSYVLLKFVLESELGELFFMERINDIFIATMKEEREYPYSIDDMRRHLLGI